MRSALSATYSAEESARVREAGKTLLTTSGIDKMATELGLKPVALLSTLNGGKPLEPAFVEGVARLKNVSVDELLGRVAVAPPASTSAEHAPPAPPVVAGPVPPPLIGAPPAMEPTVAGPPVVFDEARAAASPPAPLATPLPTTPPIGVVSAPSKSTAESAHVTDGVPQLTLMEYASLSMGLELLPHREVDVLGHFGLGDPNVRQRETDHWTTHLKTSARDRREFPAMRERMRMYWMRFDGQVVSAPVSSRMEPEARASMPTPMPAPVQPPPPPPISLEAYAALCVELHRSPATAESTFAFYGLNDPRSREYASRYWTERFGIYPNERGEWERLYHAKAQELEARSSHVPAAPMPTHYVSALKTTGDHVAPLTMSLNAYALLCVELEKKPNEREQVYKRHGLADAQKRRQAEEGWRARLESDPAERAKWQQLTDEIRADWMDF